ncbi:MAG TPA: CopD family protein [Gallionellaceae bacterium]|nr:CopD family protein [Gallionellaceae bacterium]
MLSFMKLIHLLAIVVWVGGMFFAYVVLRPSAAEILQPPERLRLWDKVFSQFFNWVWLAVSLVLISGFYMIYLFGGFSNLSLYINLMLGMGLVMTMIYVYVFFKCYVPFNRLVAKQEWPAAGAMLATIRKLVALNLTIGLLTVAVAIIGRGI